MKKFLSYLISPTILVLAFYGFIMEVEWAENIVTFYAWVMLVGAILASLNPKPKPMEKGQLPRHWHLCIQGATIGILAAAGAFLIAAILVFVNMAISVLRTRAEKVNAK